MDNGVINTKDTITITVFPSEEGFGCSVVEPKMSPLTQEYSVALTIAHGMVKLALETPDIVFDAGIESLTSPSENTSVSIVDLFNKKKHRLN